MRILYHHRTRAREAQWVHIAEMVEAFRKIGHSIEIVSLARRKEPLNASREGHLAGWQVLVRRTPFAHEILQLGYNLIGIPLLLWKVIRSNPDFIYERYALFNFTGVFVAKLLSIPIVLEVNSPFALEQGRDGDIRAVRFATWTEKVICNAATKVTVVTNSLCRIMVANGIKPQRLVVMHNGVNLTHFAPGDGVTALRRRFGVEGKFVIGYIGWFNKWHNLHLLVDAFHLACLGSKGAVLLLVGHGPELESVRKKIEFLQIAEFVILSGGLPHEVVPKYLDIVDIAVLPAANEYCCPIKILEYMALAKSIVAPRQANIQELLCDGEEALLFSPGDAVALGHALEELLADRSTARILGGRAYLAISRKGFLWVRNAERVIQLVVDKSRCP